ncbi:MAG: hypothetical protein KJ906_00250 [Nanoarchaeota archaeon]|nr:hypothetical protein [Nanoarchaeota archaeon]
MDLAINKMITIVLVIVVLVALLLVLSGTVTEPGRSLGEQSKLKSCCGKYLANDCNPATIGFIECDDGNFLSDFVIPNGDYSEDQIYSLCDCP